MEYLPNMMKMSLGLPSTKIQQYFIFDCRPNFSIVEKLMFGPKKVLHKCVL